MRLHNIDMVGRGVKSTISSLGIGVLLCLYACGGAKPQPDNDKVIPDPPQLVSELVFADPKLQECIDDRFIMRVEDITSLTCYGLKDLTGIGQLRELEFFVFGGQDLEFVDLSKNNKKPF